MSEWNLSDQELLIQKASIIKMKGKELDEMPYFFAKADVMEFIKRLKDECYARAEYKSVVVEILEQIDKLAGADLR